MDVIHFRSRLCNNQMFELGFAVFLCEGGINNA